MGIKQELQIRKKTTCLYDKHVEMGALMSPFAGFDMPIVVQIVGNVTAPSREERLRCIRCLSHGRSARYRS